MPPSIGNQATTGAALRATLPFYVPVVTVTAILAVLFWFGVREQERLRADHIERMLGALEQSERQVANDIRAKLTSAERSLARYQDSLVRNLSRLDASQITAGQAHFQHMTEPLADGTTRSRRTDFDGSREAGIWLPRQLQAEPKQQALMARAKRLTDLFGRGAQDNIFADTWWLPGPGGIVFYGPTPDLAEFVFQAEPDYSYADTDWLTLVLPDNNPQGGLRWTPLAFDPTPKIWMFSCVLPLYLDGQWWGSVGHDVPLEHLLAQVSALGQVEGSGFVLVTRDDKVVASDRYADQIIASNGALTLAELSEPLFARAAADARQATQLSQGGDRRITTTQHVAFVSHIPAQDWLLINVVPLAPITGPVQLSFERLRNLTVTALLLELIIATGVLWWNHRQTRRGFTELATVHGELAAREQRLTTLIANLPGVVYRRSGNNNGQVDYISPMISNLSGYPASEFLTGGRRQLVSLIHPADVEAVQLEWHRAHAAGKPYLLEYRLVHAKGPLLWVQDRGRPVYDDTGHLQGMEGVIFDITEQRQIAEQLKRMNDQLERLVDERTADLRHSNAELESFTYTVSHDLRAPLRHIFGYLQLLREALGATTDDVNSVLTRIDAASQRMNALIESLLSLSRLGEAAVRWDQVDLDALCAEVCTELDNGKVQWQRESLGQVAGDTLLLRQVLINLLSNAVKYSAKVATPIVRIALAPNLARSGEAVLEIADNGVGFDPQYADRLFQVFHRLHSQQEFTGEGIGLATVAKIIRLHGGRVWADSSPGEGARFYVALPTQRINPTQISAATTATVPTS